MLTTFILCHVVLNFFFNASNPTKFYTLSLHDALPISPLPNLDGHVRQGDALIDPLTLARALGGATAPIAPCGEVERLTDRKSTRLNSSHTVISYAVFCLKKKKKYDIL